MVVGPGLFEAMREELDGRIALASPDQKAGGSGAESTDGPKNIFHCLPPVVRLICDSCAAPSDLDALSVENVFSQRELNAHG